MDEYVAKWETNQHGRLNVFTEHHEILKSTAHGMQY